MGEVPLYTPTAAVFEQDLHGSLAQKQPPPPRTTVQGYLARKNPPPVGPYCSPMPRDLW